MGSVITGFTDMIGLTDSGAAGDQALAASQLEAGYQTEALDYLKEREALPQAFREAGLERLGSEYGLTLDQEGNILSDGGSIDERIQTDPRYLSAREAGSDAIMRHQSMTGGLRSGNTQDALYRADADLYNRAYEDQLTGLRGFANLPSNANQIAAGTAGIGRTLGQGQVAQAQSNVAAENQAWNDVIGIGTLGLSAYTGGMI